MTMSSTDWLSLALALLIVLLPLWLARWLVRRDNSLDDATDE